MCSIPLKWRIPVSILRSRIHCYTDHWNIRCLKLRPYSIDTLEHMDAICSIRLMKNQFFQIAFDRLQFRTFRHLFDQLPTLPHPAFKGCPLSCKVMYGPHAMIFGREPSSQLQRNKNAAMQVILSWKLSSEQNIALNSLISWSKSILRKLLTCLMFVLDEN